MKYILILIIVVTMSFSCKQKENLTVQIENGVVVAASPRWSEIFSIENDQLNNGVLRRDVQYEGNVLLPKQLSDRVVLTMISAETGEEIWTWDDFFPIDARSPFISSSYHNDKILAFGGGSRFYVIDLSNGQTLHKARPTTFSIRRISGFDNTVLVSGSEDDPNNGYRIPAVYHLTDQTNGIEKIFEAPQTYEVIDRFNRTGQIGSPKRIKIESGDDILCYAYSVNTGDNGNIDDILLGAYNYTADTMFYEGKETLLNTDVGPNGPDLVLGTKVFVAPTTSIIAYEGKTGEELWSTSFPDGFTFSGYIAADGKILANCEDTYLYALDAETGRELWQEKSSGTSSKMLAHNGVVYFVGGGDGLLHAVEIETGRHLWKIRSPHLELNSGAWFMRKVNIVPSEIAGEKATVVVSSYIGAFGYEAAR